MVHPSLKGRRALVTGAASGIGRATAEAMARAGAEVVLLDRDAAGLDNLAAALGADQRGGAAIQTHTVDVGDREAMRACADAVHKAGGALDILVNNAGIAVGGPFLSTPLEAWDRVVRVNLMGVVHGCHFFLPAMVESGRGGHLVNVSSAAGLLGLRNVSAYSATKFAVRALTESLCRELAPHGIGATAIFPGFIKTAIGATTEMSGPDADRLKGLATGFLHERGAAPERVADAILAAIDKRRSRVPVTGMAWAMYLGSKLAPDLMQALFDRASDRILGKPS